MCRGDFSLYATNSAHQELMHPWMSVSYYTKGISARRPFSSRSSLVLYVTGFSQ